MSWTSSRLGLTSLFALALVLPGPAGSDARAQAVDPAVQRGLAFLKAKVGREKVGETALIALAMLKSDVPPGDPALATCVAALRSRFESGVYKPERTGGHDIYEAAVVCLALANLDAESRRGELTAAAAFLMGRQNANGSWDYIQRTYGDTSITQYAVLGLWEAENAGVPVPPRVWDRAAAWFLSVQNQSSGSWNYHRDEPDAHPETISMTAAGLGSLLICQRQLLRYRRGLDSANPLLQPLVAEGTAGAAKYVPEIPTARIDQAVKRGLGWLSNNFATASSPLIGPSAYYGLYGIERLGALADKDTLGRASWFETGRQFIISHQRADGAWDSTHGDTVNTAWAILFITKSTAKTLRRIEIKRLGAGTLLGGRFLPKDLTNLTVAGGRVVNRPMNGAVEGMLAVLEDPRAENADAALGGLINRYRTEGPAVLRTHKDRFRRMLADRDPDVRQIAAWSLARTGDLDTAPLLIDALNDPQEKVVQSAREGLQLLSRKVEGLGPTAPSTPDDRKAAAARWRHWYTAIRPLDLEGQDEAAKEPKTAPTPAGAPQ